MQVMKKHVKNYLKQTGKHEGDFIACEYCGSQANDIHHVLFGRYKRSDEPDNLVALCRYCHDMAHGKIIDKPQINPDELLEIARERIN